MASDARAAWQKQLAKFVGVARVPTKYLRVGSVVVSVVQLVPAAPISFHHHEPAWLSASAASPITTMVVMMLNYSHG